MPPNPIPGEVLHALVDHSNGRRGRSRFRRPRWWLTATLTLSAVILPWAVRTTMAGVDPAVPPGRWTGQVIQQPFGSYPVEITVPEAGDQPYRVDYPSLQCGGSLTLTSEDGPRVVLKERISYDEARQCTNGGIVHLKLEADGTLEYEWLFPDGRRAAFAKLMAAVAEARASEPREAESPLQAPKVPADVAPAEPGSTKYLGCFQDRQERDLAGFSTTDADLTVERCAATCRLRGYAYAGTQFHSECFCGNDFGRYGPAEKCTSVCSGKPGEMCGGEWANSVYQVKEPEPGTPQSRYAEDPTLLFRAKADPASGALFALNRTTRCGDLFTPGEVLVELPLNVDVSKDETLKPILGRAKDFALEQCPKLREYSDGSLLVYVFNSKYRRSHFPAAAAIMGEYRATDGWAELTRYENRLRANLGEPGKRPDGERWGEGPPDWLVGLVLFVIFGVLGWMVFGVLLSLFGEGRGGSASSGASSGGGSYSSSRSRRSRRRRKRIGGKGRGDRRRSRPKMFGRRKCPDCSGTWLGAGNGRCSQCRGTGFELDPSENLSRSLVGLSQRCSRCDGKKKCRTCFGNGFLR